MPIKSKNYSSIEDKALWDYLLKVENPNKVGNVTEDFWVPYDDKNAKGVVHSNYGPGMSDVAFSDLFTRYEHDEPAMYHTPSLLPLAVGHLKHSEKVIRDNYSEHTSPGAGDTISLGRVLPFAQRRYHQGAYSKESFKKVVKALKSGKEDVIYNTLKEVSDNNYGDRFDRVIKAQTELPSYVYNLKRRLSGGKKSK